MASLLWCRLSVFGSLKMMYPLRSLLDWLSASTTSTAGLACVSESDERESARQGYIHHHTATVARFHCGDWEEELRAQRNTARASSASSSSLANHLHGYPLTWPTYSPGAWQDADRLMRAVIRNLNWGKLINGHGYGCAQTSDGRTSRLCQI